MIQLSEACAGDQPQSDTRNQRQAVSQPGWLASSGGGGAKAPRGVQGQASKHSSKAQKQRNVLFMVAARRGISDRQRSG